MITSLFGFTLVSVLILKNTFIPEMWLDIVSFGFVKMPGVIFDLSFDVIIFLIAVNFFGFLIEMFLAIAVFIFATAVSLIIILFVYPLAFFKNIKCKD